MLYFKAELQYYLREKLWKTAITYSENEIKKAGKDPYISFFSSIAKFKENSLIDAIREAKSSGVNKEFKFSSICALIHYHENSVTKDNQEIENLNNNLNRLKNEAKSLLAADIIHAMRFYFYVNNIDKFYECDDLLINNNLKSTDGDEIIVRGWNLCYSPNEDEISQANDLFTKYLNEYGGANLDAVMGGFKSLERLKKDEVVLDSFTAVASEFQKFKPLIIEKAKIFLNLNQFDNAIEFIKSEAKYSHFELTKVQIVCCLINEGNVKEGLKLIEKYWSEILQQEPLNHELFYESAKLFSRICDRNIAIIDKCEEMINKAISFDFKNVDYILEKAAYNNLKSNYQVSEKAITEALAIDYNNCEAQLKNIEVKILKGKHNDLLEELNKIEEKIVKTRFEYLLPQILMNKLYLNIQIFVKEEKYKYQGNDYVKALDEKFSAKFDEVLKLHIQIAKQRYFSKYEIIIQTNYDFLCDLAKLALNLYSISDHKFDSSNLPNIISKTKKIIDSLTKNKYFTTVFLLNSKLKYITMDKHGAISSIESLLKTNPSCSLDAYTLYIMICNNNKDFNKSKQLINDAQLNCYSKIKNNIHFLIAKVYTDFGLNDIKNAEINLKNVIDLFNSIEAEKGKENSNEISKNKKDEESKDVSIFTLNSSEKISLMKLQLEILLKKDMIKEGQDLINQMIKENPDLGDDMIILNAEISIKLKDYKKAASLLKKIKISSGETLFIQSRIKLADIYLTSLIDRRLYSWCYQEIVDNFNNIENLKLAAAAEMHIDSPDRAITYYKEALKINPLDVLLIRDLGRSLVLTHDYSSAKNYYEETLNGVVDKLNDMNVFNYYEIVEDYIKMLIKLGDNEPQKLIEIVSIIDSFTSLLKKLIQKFTDIFLLKMKLSNLLFLQGRIIKTIKYSLSKEELQSINLPTLNNAVVCFEESIKLVKDVNIKLRNNEIEVNKNKDFLAEIAYEHAKYIQIIEGDLSKADKIYLESLAYSNNKSEKAIKEIIKNLLAQKKLDEAQKYADMLIRLNENNEENLKLLVTVISNRKNNDEACIYLEEIINKQITSFKLIEIYIELIRRTGKISKVKELLSKCEKKLKFTFNAGLVYCKALYLRYTNETSTALLEFSKIKTDEYYGIKCLEQMIEIYINPDNNILFLEFPSPYSFISRDSILEYSNSEIDFQALKFLLKELQMKRDDDRTRIYECWVSLIIRDEKFIRKAIETCKDILSKNPENISAWIVLAFSNFVLKNDSECKLNLSILEKSKINDIVYYNDYERGYLLLAYLYLKSNNNSKGNDILKKVLNELNIAQVKAYELLGIIAEKDQNYKEASSCFEKAWEFSCKNNAVIGYKLAVCYLNIKKPIKAVDICNEISKKFPEYPINELTVKAKNYLN